MTPLFDKHHITSPALAPSQRRESGFGDRGNSRGALTVALINNMPDSALKATERQFARLLSDAAGGIPVDLYCFSLPSIARSQSAQWHVDGEYSDIAELGRLRVDGLIVTGAEPIAPTLQEEPYWQDLADIIDWAKANTRSAIWSCLAAHAAVLHLDGIERHRLGSKCSGIYDCAKQSDEWLTNGIMSPLRIAHSRLNEIRERDLLAHGYRVLTTSQAAGIDIFAKSFGSEFLFFQGHPEYDAESLQREYLRDITRFLSGERDSYPAFPVGYFDPATEAKLANYEKHARRDRKMPLGIELPSLALRQDLSAGTAAVAILRNWIGYLANGTKADPPSAELGTRQ
jgi:homoserine O-succinyltransferase/O-acetyltransferase